ncbi:hypothetical protein ACOYW6_00655 [Parablastomonas sp. CN1-191]|uniref:hypothetical protein n=1 Tax=Parablastomonas sp. CN1-191 TaxID=3400908 RepID=UPI003BF8DFB7
MIVRSFVRFGAAAVLAAAVVAAPAQAQHWSRGGWGTGIGVGVGTTFGDRPYSRSSRGEGKVEVSTFVNTAAGLPALGQGAIVVAPGAGPRDPVFEAALVDVLGRHGYNTAAATAPQVVELTVVRDIAEPAERKHNPVSGEVGTTISNRGSGMGIGIGIDLSKPRKALLSTRLEARIRDRASNAVLWEGRADMLTRDGSSKWTDQAVAAKLAEALFAKFPKPVG